MLNNNLRVGNISSSEGAVAMMGEGKRDMTPEELAARPKKGKGSSTTTISDLSVMPESALKYIQECNWERRLGRSIEKESNARPLTWGKAVENRVFDLLGISYQLVSEETLQHPEIPYWVGSPDANKFDDGRTVVDIKCPITLKSFCQLVEPLYKKGPDGTPLMMKEVDGKWVLDGLQAINYIRETHTDGEKYYWQLVSNAVITKSKYAELIVYAPFESEIPEIQQMCAPSQDVPAAWNWIYYASQEELPYLLDGGFYNNINIIRFEVPVEDKQNLKTRMIMAKPYLD